MKQVALMLGLLAIGATYAAPRYLVIPIEDVEFMENMELPVYPYGTLPQMQYRVRRQAQEGAPAAPQAIFIPQPQASRRDGGPHGGPPDGIPPFSIPAEIRQAEDAITAGSNTYAHGSHGPDYVDYGAYTGGYGAFGWYSDHPVGGGYHR